MTASANRIDVEVVFATCEAQELIALSLPAGATLADAIRASELAIVFPQYPIEQMATGIWGQRATHEQLLQNGDRVEVYRELERDPMEARRLRASG
jgi:putative ubiquitin-RnfH superfamily antitoxin RatB of RatAB toxin-antitoxin module